MQGFDGYFFERIEKRNNRVLNLYADVFCSVEHDLKVVVDVVTFLKLIIDWVIYEDIKLAADP